GAAGALSWSFFARQPHPSQRLPHRLLAHGRLPRRGQPGGELVLGHRGVVVEPRPEEGLALGRDAARVPTGTGAALGGAGRALEREPAAERGVADAEPLGDGGDGAVATLVRFDGTAAEVEGDRHGGHSLEERAEATASHLPRHAVFSSGPGSRRAPGVRRWWHRKVPPYTARSGFRPAPRTSRAYCHHLRSPLGCRPSW